MAEKEYSERGKAFENEYISRREAIKARKRSCDKNCLECDFAIEGDSWCNGEVFVVDLLRIPAADVRPVVKAIWKHVQWVVDEEWQEGGYWISRCSNCSMPYHEETPFCPHCGADMREES